MNVQLIIVIAVVVIAVAFAGKSMVAKRRSFSTKPGCEHDCGCNGGGKSIRS